MPFGAKQNPILYNRMLCLLSTLLLFLATLVWWSAQAQEEDDKSYSFDQYVADFGKTYFPQNHTNNNEYAQRRRIFDQNVAAIQQHNRQQHHHGYRLGINQFTDQLSSELYMGYAKSHRLMYNKNPAHKLTANLESILTTEPVSQLPKHVDWRRQGISTPVKNQYTCGSCWAFATTSALESHVALHTGVLYELSEQQLVSCTGNPLHCGGTGGCDGSIPEIAMEYVRTHGMVDAWTFGYASKNGTTVPCTLEQRDTLEWNGSDHVQKMAKTKRYLDGNGGATDNDDETNYLPGAVVTLDSWITLPRNNYTAVMNAVAKMGPLIVTVACVPWISYQRGVFSGALNTRDETNVSGGWAAGRCCLEGYGTDKETGEDYWLIKNSFGARWGESGYIRLKRVDPETLEDPETDCGIDRTPENGVACTIDKHGNPIDPPAERICGTSGILYDVSIPLGARLL
eukprot:scaffold426_cov219-Amphora_coffeaeformis.AAC.36